MKITVDDRSGKHAPDLEGLRRPGVTFWTVTDDDGTVVGCGARNGLDGDHTAVESMRTASAHQRAVVGCG